MYHHNIHLGTQSMLQSPLPHRIMSCTRVILSKIILKRKDNALFKCNVLTPWPNFESKLTHKGSCAIGKHADGRGNIVLLTLCIQAMLSASRCSICAFRVTQGNGFYCREETLDLIILVAHRYFINNEDIFVIIDVEIG
jgi:hypothetical protein